MEDKNRQSPSPLPWDPVLLYVDPLSQYSAVFPHYRTVCNLIPTTELPRNGTFTLKIGPKNFPEEIRQVDTLVKLHLICTREIRKCPLPIESITVNQTEIPIPRPSALLRLSVDISHVLCDSLSGIVVEKDNEISVKMDQDFRENTEYLYYVSIVKKKAYGEMLSELKARQIESSVTRMSVVASMNKSTNRWTNCKKIISTKCPLGRSEMVIPCKGRTCNHYECFDATVFLPLFERGLISHCPICDNLLDCTDLDIDGFFTKILEMKKGHPKSQCLVDFSGETEIVDVEDNPTKSDAAIPGFEVIYQLVEPTDVSVPSNRKVSFTLPPNYSTSSSNNPVMVKLRIVRKRPEEGEFVFVANVEVNRKLVTLPTTQLTTLTLDVTSYLDNNGASNLVSISPVYGTTDDTYYHISVVKGVQINQMLMDLMMEPQIPADITRQFVIDSFHKLGNWDLNKIVDKHKIISVSCAINKSRMTIPCKGLSCEHADCFDAVNALRVMEGPGILICPFCNVPLIFEDLRVDSYFEELLRQLPKAWELKIAPITANGEISQFRIDVKSARIERAKKMREKRWLLKKPIITPPRDFSRMANEKSKQSLEPSRTPTPTKKTIIKKRFSQPRPKTMTFYKGGEATVSNEGNIGNRNRSSTVIHHTNIHN